MKTLERLEVHGTADTKASFLRLRQLLLRNHYTDGTRSELYEADVMHRVGIDAVAVVAWRRAGEDLEICLRECFRPGVALHAEFDPPVPDPAGPRCTLWEIPAGIPEADERGPEGLARCGARELAEETGLRIAAEDLQPLGAGFYPIGGTVTEMLHLFAVEVATDAQLRVGMGDGSPFEEIGGCRWWTAAAIRAACLEGTIADAKTEIATARLCAAQNGLTTA